MGFVLKKVSGVGGFFLGRERGGFLDDGAFLSLIENLKRRSVGFFYKVGKSRQRIERLTITHQEGQ